MSVSILHTYRTPVQFSCEVFTDSLFSGALLFLLRAPFLLNCLPFIGGPLLLHSLPAQVGGFLKLFLFLFHGFALLFVDVLSVLIIENVDLLVSFAVVDFARKTLLDFFKGLVFAGNFEVIHLCLSPLCELAPSKLGPLDFAWQIGNNGCNEDLSSYDEVLCQKTKEDDICSVPEFGFFFVEPLDKNRLFF